MQELIKGKHLGPFQLFSAKPGTCQECAVDHNPELPHNRQSLFYQYKFYNEHGRWPTWEDAMAHCSEEMKEFWRSELTKKGVNLS
ncbi:MAG: hypothetical protein KGZ56_00850 [Dethiobacter sp.]|nr:hypothetical protein [Dethiobacter sp.]MBS3898681.1 hypothetical protein [Dethiobacter sp.]